MKKSSLLLMMLLFTVLILACGTTIPTPSPEDDLAQLATMVAATVEAAQNMDAQPTSMPVDAATPTAEPEAPTSYPDFPGLRVAYIKAGNVYLWTEGGNLLGITGTGDAIDVQISDDGAFVAYVRELAPNTYELWVVNTDGSVLVPQMLVSQAEMNALQAASEFADAAGFDFDQIEWRPGTHELYYSTVPRFMGPGYAPLYDIRVVNVDNAAKTTLFEFGEGGKFTFSPDGIQMALVTPENISLVNADGSNLRTNVLTYPSVITYSEYYYHPVPIWDSASASLRVAVPPADPLAEPLMPTTLWYLPIDGTSATQLGSIPAVPFDWPDHAFSPDMSYVAYIKSVGEPAANQRELHIAYADGSNDYIFASGESLQFRGWLPDAMRFVYAANGAGDQGLYLGSISGGTSTIASINQEVRQVDWVDASRMIYLYDNSGTSELRISDQDGVAHAFIDTLTDSYAIFDFTP